MHSCGNWNGKSYNIMEAFLCFPILCFCSVPQKASYNFSLSFQILPPHSLPIFLSFISLFKWVHSILRCLHKQCSVVLTFLAQKERGPFLIFFFFFFIVLCVLKLKLKFFNNIHCQVYDPKSVLNNFNRIS